MLQAESRLRSRELAQAEAAGPEKVNAYKARRHEDIKLTNQVCFQLLCGLVLVSYLKQLR